MSIQEFSLCYTYHRDDVACFMGRFYICTPLDTTFITPARLFGLIPMQVHRTEGFFSVGEVPEGSENWTEVEFTQ